ncbi:MAG: polyprenyl synthetase family protein [Acidobacteriaceae bacterium]
MVLDSFGTVLEHALCPRNESGGLKPLSLWAELAVRSCRAVGGKPNTAAALGEAAHAYFLSADVLDDVEDHDGLGALWQSVGLGPAVNAGSGLLLLAFDSLLRTEALGVPATRVLAAARCLARGGLRACRGQHIDLTQGASGQMTLSRYHRVMNLKAGSLVAAACASGALVCGGDRKATGLLASFGLHLGISLQIANDLRSLRQSEGAKSDWASGKRTLPVLYVLRQASHPLAQGLRTLMDTDRNKPGAQQAALWLLEEAGGFAFAQYAQRLELDVASARLRALRARGIHTAELEEATRIS